MNQAAITTPHQLPLLLQSSQQLTPIHATVSDGQNGSLHFAAQRNLTTKAYQFIATEICELALSTAEPHAEIDLSLTPADKKQYIYDALHIAIAKAISEGRFTEENKPKIVNASEFASPKHLKSR